VLKVLKRVRFQIIAEKRTLYSTLHLRKKRKKELALMEERKELALMEERREQGVGLRETAEKDIDVGCTLVLSTTASGLIISHVSNIFWCLRKKD